MRFFAVAAPGLEDALRAELAALPGCEGAVRVDGGVEWDGDAASAARANLWSRLATRILLRAGEVKARDFATLRKGVGRMEWERWTAGPATVEAAVTARKSRLFHTGALAERVEGGVRDRVSGTGGPPLGLVVRGVEDVFTVSVDLTGELLHRRGWREEQGEAPLRETLAAGVLALAGWKPGEALVDPMCGSGTIVIEAALWSAGRAPGEGRAFAWESMPAFAGVRKADIVRGGPPEVARGGPPEVARGGPPEVARGGPPEVAISKDSPGAVGGGRDISCGSDRDAHVIDLARRNAVRARVDATFAMAPVSSAPVPSGGPPGWIITNPPYGQRLGDPAKLKPLYAALGSLKRQHPGWRLAFLASDARLAAAAGRATRVHPLSSGGLRVALYVFDD